MMRCCVQTEAGIRDATVTGVQTCALPISAPGEISMAHHGVLVEEEHAVVRHADLPRGRRAAAADHARVTDGMVRRAERAHGQERSEERRAGKARRSGRHAMQHAEGETYVR